ncbi:MAG TPA: hypothetical protein VJV39_20905 [Dongiaceae bacterium]|nr:hypothetical protein [Dongiaceae bacterium]
MAEQLYSSDADPISLGEIAALIGEMYLVMLAVMVVVAASATAVGVPEAPAFIPIDDPAIAAAFTA